MESYTVNYLLADLNRRIQRPDQNDLLLSALRKVRSVFSDIGYRFVCDPQIIEAKVVDGRWRIPDEVVKIYHVGDSLNCFFPGYKIGKNGYFQSLLRYSKTPYELVFKHGWSGTVFVSAYLFYKDEKDQLMIPGEAYNACYETCLVDGIYNLNNPQHPLWQERMIMEQKAERAVFKARGAFNEPEDA